MCGIAGIVWTGHENTELVISKALLSIKARGPDQAGFYIDQYVGLAHTRLSIIDPNNGIQPFFVEGRDEILIYNGEIFNYEELRTKIESKGVSLNTKSDTELLFHLLVLFGADAIGLLNGQFSLCFYMPSQKQLLFARDPFGEKPLFYIYGKNQFAFASEAKALVAMTGIKPKICKKQMLSVAKTWSTNPSESIFTDIHQLPPGCIMTHNESGELKIFHQNVALNSGKKNMAGEDLSTLIASSVKDRTRSDAPIGLLLSGGIDSSIIGYEMLNIKQCMPISTFSVCFDNDFFDENYYQKMMAEALKSDHNILLFNDEMLINNLDKSIFATEMPSHRLAFVAMYCLHKKIHSHGIKVVLSGEGSDELLFGYDIFTETFIKNQIKKGASYEQLEPYIASINSFLINDPNYHQMSKLKYSNYNALSDSSEWDASHSQRVSLGAKAIQLLNTCIDTHDSIRSNWHSYLEKRYPDFDKLNEYRRAQIIESETLLSGHLLSTQGDRVSMANSIETRMPFLDPKIVNFTQSQNIESFFFSNPQEKYCLKRLYKNKLPRQIIDRRKHPFRAPDSELLLNSEPGREYVYSCSTELHAINDIFEENFSKIFLEECLLRKKLSPRDNFAFNLLITTLSLQKQFSQINYDNCQLFFSKKRWRTNFGAVHQVMDW
jgi:asparagine synthase (glutamine-hydrolysing)